MDKKPKQPKQEKVLIDESGTAIAVKYLDPVVVDRHKIVEDIIKKVLEKEKELREFKNWAYTKIETYLDKTAGRYGEKWKGNASLLNFSQDKQVSFRINDIIVFDERLSIAKNKIDEFIKSKTEGGDDDLRLLVLKAFQVDKKGNINVKQIISLKTYKINHPLWKEAMQIIEDALKVVATKEYINFAVRPTPKSEWHSISLNFSAMEIEKKEV